MTSVNVPISSSIWNVDFTDVRDRKVTTIDVSNRTHFGRLAGVSSRRTEYTNCEKSDEIVSLYSTYMNYYVITHIFVSMKLKKKYEALIGLVL